MNLQQVVYKSGNSNFGTTQVNFSIASRVQVNKKDFLKVGIAGAWTQRYLSTRHLTWNSQFDGKIIDAGLSSGESYFDRSISYIDCSIGMLWTHNFRKNIGDMLNIGLYLAIYFSRDRLPDKF